MFVELWGHAFGLASAVLTYNRDPELHQAIMRTLLATPCVHFYDDHLTVDLVHAQGSGQKAYVDLCSITGKVLDKEKHADMHPTFIFTGCEVRLDDVFSQGRMVIAAKPGRLAQVSNLMHNLQTSGICTPAQAATLLGKCGFIGTQLQGRILRYADRPLIERQYSKTKNTAMTARLAWSMIFIEEAFRRLPPKSVLLSAEEPLSVIYSDAAYEPGKPMTFGWVLFQSGQRPRAGYGTVPTEVAAQFKTRKNQIFIGELLGALSAVHTCRSQLHGHRLLHFVDNQGALAALISGFSSQDDCCSVACLYQLIAAEAGIRPWFEYVESEANIADGPSRVGAAWSDSAEAVQISCTMEPARLPDLSRLFNAPPDALGAFSALMHN